MNESQQFLSETLFHFLGKGTDDDLLTVLKSIVQRGLLLTVGNKEGALDSFQMGVPGGGVEKIEVMQQARVCFTDIPIDKLAAHCADYGKFAVGFSRNTIINWGGNPVLYMPNHAGQSTLKEGMASTLYGLHRAALLVEGFNSLLTGGLNHVASAADQDDMPLVINGKQMRGLERNVYIEHARQCIYRVLSFGKEMSSRTLEDYRYLYEREWRIVAGAQTGGIDPCRQLTAAERNELVASRPRWGKPLAVETGIIAKYPHSSMIELFRFFNGLNRQPVSQSINTILVPSEAMARRVREFVAARADQFRSGGINVEILS